MRGADDGADVREAARPGQLLAELVHEARDVVPQRPAVRELQVLNVGPALVGALDNAEEPRTLSAAGGEERLERIAAEVRIDGHGVGEGRLPGPRLEEGGRVGAGGRADVPTLGVRELEQPRLAGVGTEVLERAQPVGAVRLEGRALWLHAADERRDRVDD